MGEKVEETQLCLSQSLVQQRFSICCSGQRPHIPGKKSKQHTGGLQKQQLLLEKMGRMCSLEPWLSTQKYPSYSWLLYLWTSIVLSCSPAPAKNSRPVYTSFNLEAQGFRLWQSDKSIFHQPGTPSLALIAFWINNRRALPQVMFLTFNRLMLSLTLWDARCRLKQKRLHRLWYGAPTFCNGSIVVCLIFTFIIFDVLTHFAAVFWKLYYTGLLNT